MQYDNLTEETQTQILTNTLLDIEQQHFATTLAMERAKAIEDENQVALFTKTLADLSKQREAVKALGQASA